MGRCFDQRTIRNTVNLGDGVNAMTAGYHLGEIYEDILTFEVKKFLILL